MLTLEAGLHRENKATTVSSCFVCLSPSCDYIPLFPEASLPPLPSPSKLQSSPSPYVLFPASNHRLTSLIPPYLLPCSSILMSHTLHLTSSLPAISSVVSIATYSADEGVSPLCHYPDPRMTSHRQLCLQMERGLAWWGGVGIPTLSHHCLDTVQICA